MRKLIYGGFAFLFVSLVIAIVYFAFLKRDVSVEEYTLKAVKSVSSTPDTLIKFIVAVSDIEYDESQDKIYVSDFQAGCIAVFDSNLNFLYRVGRRGKGPGEFSYVGGIKKYKNFLYVLDAGKIQILKDDRYYAGSFRVPWFPGVEFDVDLDGNIIIGAYDSLLAVIDTTGKVLKMFGKKVEQKNEQETFLKNGVWPVVDEKRNIYAVFLSLPYIRKYSKNFDLLSEKRLKEEVRYGLKTIEEMEKKHPGVRATMVGGVYYRSPYLYVRYASPESEPVIYVYDAETLELRKKLKLETGKHINNFIVDKNNNIVGFDLKNGELVKYVVK